MTDKLKPRDTWPGSITNTTVGAYARRSMGVHKQEQYALPKPPNAAGQITFKSSKLKDVVFPKMEATRPGADDHLKIKTLGIEST